MGASELMHGLASFGWWKVGLILALFLTMFVMRGLSGGKPEVRLRRRRRFPPRQGR